MLLIKTTLVLFQLLHFFHGLVVGNHEKELLIAMPNVSPERDVHFNRAIKLDPDHPIYITGFEKQLQYARHGLVLACTETFSLEDIWLGDDSCSDPYDSIIFTSVNDGSNLYYPEDTGLKVGGDSVFKYIVLRIHYTDMTPFLLGAVDSSGVKILYTTTEPKYLAGQLMLQSNGYIQPGEMEYFESAITIDEDVVLHPFKYRVHTHVLGLVVVAYRVRDDQWTEIGRRSPQLSQIYIPARPVTLRKGDIVTMRCTLFNFEDHIVQMGSTLEDEMCRFYLYYYVDRTTVFSKNSGISEGPPKYYWRLDERLDASKIPADASEIPPPPNGPDPNDVAQQGSMSHDGMHEQ